MREQVATSKPKVMLTLQLPCGGGEDSLKAVSVPCSIRGCGPRAWQNVNSWEAQVEHAFFKGRAESKSRMWWTVSPH